MLLKYSSLFQLHIRIRQIFFIYFIQNISQQTDYREYLKIQLSFIVTNKRDSQRCKIMWLFSLFWYVCLGLTEMSWKQEVWESLIEGVQETCKTPLTSPGSCSLLGANMSEAGGCECWVCHQRCCRWGLGLPGLSCGLCRAWPLEAMLMVDLKEPSIQVKGLGWISPRHTCWATWSMRGLNRPGPRAAQCWCTSCRSQLKRGYTDCFYDEDWPTNIWKSLQNPPDYQTRG